MEVRAPKRRTRRLAFLGLLVVAAALIAGYAGAARTNQDDLRNFSYGLVYQGTQNDCWKHHRGEGMYDSHIVIPILPKAIKVGEPTELQLQVENAWKYDLSAIKVVLNLVGNETFIVPLVGSAAETTPPYRNSWRGVLGSDFGGNVPPPPGHPPSEAWNNFTIGNGAVLLVAHGEVYYPPGSGAVTPNQASFHYTEPRRTTTPAWPNNTQTDPTWNLTITNPQAGDWRIGARYQNGGATEVTYAINVTVFYRAAGANEVIVHEQVRSPQTPPNALVGPRGVTDVISIPVVGIREGRQPIELNVSALLYWDHQSGATPDEDTFYRVATAEILVGQEYVASDVQAATGGTVEVDLYLMSGEVTGFASAFLLLPSLLLGGTYGRASRKLLNDLLGGAKRRVMFHNLVSLGLTMVALVHIIFFLLEVRYTVMMGVLWGGLGALTLLILGVTGYYQVPLIQKYGYNWWRYLHLVTGILVIVFVAWHSIADGPDFFFMKEQMPGWLQDLNWERMENLK